MPLQGWFEGEQIALENNMQQQELAMKKQQLALEAQRTQASVAMQQAEAQQMQQTNDMRKREMSLQMQMMEQASGGAQGQQQGKSQRQGGAQGMPQGGGQGGPMQQAPQQQQQDPLQALSQEIVQTERYADLAWKMGMPDQAMAAAEKAATLQVKKQEVETGRETAAYKKLQTQQKLMEDADQMISGVKNADDWEAMKADFARRHPNQTNPFEKIPYSPKIVEQIRNGTKAGLDHLKQEMEKQNIQSEIQDRSSAEGFRAWREKFSEQQASIRNARMEARSKEAGKEVSYPGAEALKITRDALAKKYPNLPPDELENYAFDVASRAKAMTARNKGLDPGAALTAALNDPAHVQDVKTVDTAYGHYAKKVPFFGEKLAKGHEESHYNPDGMPLPDKQADLKKDAIYQTSKGKAKWNGKAFELITTQQAPSVPSSGEENEEEEEDE